MPNFTSITDENGITKYYRDGVELEKGITLTQERIEKNRQLYEKIWQFYSAYPDLYIDLITPSDSEMTLFFYQRIFLRALMRYKQIAIIAPRAFSKTFISVLGIILQCIFIPKSKRFICAPKKEQGAKVAKEKFDEIFDKYPLLRKEVLSYTTSTDNIKLTFRNGSIFDVVAALDSQRGGRRHGGLVDELRDHDPDTISEVILPLMNVKRRMSNGKVNEHEPQPQQIWMSSASSKSSYCYEKIIELLESEIINPEATFVWGVDYRVPMLHGLLDKQYINEIKMSQTVKDDSFAREYLGHFTGSVADSWFDYDKLTRYRKLVNPELTQKIKENEDIFYFMSVDVGRLKCQTVVTVFKVYRGNDYFKSRVVNIVVIGAGKTTHHFDEQALEIKRMISAYQPVEILIDTNGLGVGLMDFMVKPTVGDNTVYPGYCAINDEDYSQKLYPTSIPLVFSMKSNNSLDSKIHANCYTMINSGRVIFLAREQEIKNKLLATKVGQKMKLEQRMKRLQPHELTTRLFEEMVNLKLKQVGAGLDLKLEQVNSNMGKDKFSSLEYGLWRIKEIEEDYYKKKRRKSKGKRTLTFYTQRG